MVNGAENTVINLEFIFKLLILLIICGIDSPSGPIALPPNFAIIKLVIVLC